MKTKNQMNIPEPGSKRFSIQNMTAIANGNVGTALRKKPCFSASLMKYKR